MIEKVSFDLQALDKELKENPSGVLAYMTVLLAYSKEHYYSEDITLQYQEEIHGVPQWLVVVGRSLIVITIEYHGITKRGNCLKFRMFSDRKWRTVLLPVNMMVKKND